MSAPHPSPASTRPWAPTSPRGPATVGLPGPREARAEASAPPPPCPPRAVARAPRKGSSYSSTASVRRAPGRSADARIFVSPAPNGPREVRGPGSRRPGAGAVLRAARDEQEVAHRATTTSAPERRRPALESGRHHAATGAGRTLVVTKEHDPDRPEPLALPNHRRDRCRRYGRGLPGYRHEAWPRGGPEAPSGSLRLRSRARPALRARGEAARVAQPPEHRPEFDSASDAVGVLPVRER